MDFTKYPYDTHRCKFLMGSTGFPDSLMAFTSTFSFSSSSQRPLQYEVVMQTIISVWPYPVGQWHTYAWNFCWLIWALNYWDPQLLGNNCSNAPQACRANHNNCELIYAKIPGISDSEWCNQNAAERFRVNQRMRLRAKRASQFFYVAYREDRRIELRMRAKWASEIY